MARLTSSNIAKKEEFVHPLSMMHLKNSHPLARSSSNAAAASDSARSSDGPKPVVFNDPLKDNGVQPATEEVQREVQVHPPRQNNDFKETQQRQENTSCTQVVDPPTQMIHPPSSNFVAKHKQLRQFPRSVRWRLSLGLLTDPSGGEDSFGKEDISEIAAASNPTSQLKSIEEANALKLRFQRSRYEELERKHYWSHTPIGIAAKTDSNSGHHDAAKPETATTTQHVAKGDDPLSALLDSAHQEERSPIFGFKRKPKRGSLMNNNSVHSSSTKDAHPSDENTSNEKESDRSKWAEFYSTREMLDVIEKDLNRLPTDHYTVYHSWRKRCSTAQQSGGNQKDNEKRIENKDVHGGSSNLSENTCDIMQSQLKHNNNPSLRRMFNKKLPEVEEEDEATKAKTAEKIEIETSIKERAEQLSQILFVYGQEHKNIGYRQGMHEILSYILLALETDLMEHTISKERNNWKMGLLSQLSAPDNSESNRNTGCMAGVDSSGNIVVVHLLDAQYILHDAFTLFEFIMDALASSYDVVQDINGASTGCLEAMTSSIVSKIRYIARDEALFSHVLYMPVPPQLYFAKWVRLMFGREVAGGIDEVLGLWDAFFELASATARMDDNVSVSKALMNVLKTAAASMILLIRHLLLAPTIAWDGSLTGDPDPNEGIQYLMNYPPIEDTGVFVKTITSLLAKEKLLSTQSAQKENSTQHVRKQQLQSEAPTVAIGKESPDQTTDDKEDGSSYCSSNGNFMGWPEIPNSQQSNEPNRHTHDNSLQRDISETIGTIAAGMKASFKMSFTGLKGLSDHDSKDHTDNGIRDREDAQIVDRSYNYTGIKKDDIHSDFEFDATADKEDTDFIQVVQTGISDENSNKKVSTRRRSMSIESTQSVLSHSSRMSTSKSLSESCRQDPVTLAKKLEKSVATLMKHFHHQIGTQADIPSNLSAISHHTATIPEEIWHAMADIDQVRKDLLSQSATEKLDMLD